jgi:hypothetical protein
MSNTLKYVGMSRATKSTGLFIVGDINFDSFQNGSCNKKVVNELERLRKCPLKFEFKYLFEQSSESFKIIFHNIQSINKHFEDINNDYSYKSADIMIFVEAWSLKSDKYVIENFKTINTSFQKQRRAKGNVCFVRNKYISMVFKILYYLKKILT